MNIEIPIVSAFVDGNSGGNPAGIVLNADRFSTGQKQKIAAAVGLSETAFVSPSDSADLKLEFFTPTQQIAHCGHATIATFSYLRQNGLLANDQSSKETIDGYRSIKMEGDFAFMEQKAPLYTTLSDPDLHLTLQALGLAQSDLIDGTEPTIVNTGNSFVLVGIRDVEKMKALQPDFSMIERLSKAFDLIGFYVFCLDGVAYGRDAGARMFAPRYGIREESATGMAAGPLACYLYDTLGVEKGEFAIEQGRWMPSPSPSVLTVRLEIDHNGRIQGLYAGGRGAVREKKAIVI
ncbi:PhzF family phenazine biosynthesis protein [Marinobacter changyiensis]|uniref:PhzF family phenazine biosynthesis protein n=1 Tax=Marinobacter changyiensis TaxID=2604091 RepID=UPI0012642606|nr:PhzF family phenazine biosynthesis protein [Marinobacter changyiensis]